MSTTPRRIGIWEPQPIGDHYRFVRPPEPHEQASLWANVAAIEPKGRRNRVVLIGESVARGFFFDPHFNPAMALQHLLRNAGGGPDLEVVDLARTDLTREQLLDLAAAAVQLEPDLVVVFAGNNWQPMLRLRPSAWRELADRLRNGDWADVKTHLEALLQEQVRTTLHELRGLAQTNRFKLVFVLPEFNLADWRTDATSPPLLDSGATAEWLTVRAQAEQALAVGDIATAESLGRRLIMLDGGTTAVGHNVLAGYRLRVGNVAEARRHLESARDTAICWPNGPESPRCFSAIQQTVRNEAAKQGMHLVDLPRILQGHLRGGLADRRVFLDYCHMNVTGTYVAMSAVAQVVLASLFRVRRSLEELNAIPISVAPRVEGEAHFLAAIHNANWGQPAELVRSHCAKALELAPSLDRLMNLFLDFHIRRLPSALCRSFGDLCHQGSPSAVSLLFDAVAPTAENFLNPTLIDAALGAQSAQFSETRLATENLLGEQHGFEGRSVDLLHPAYSRSSYLIPLDPSRHAYHRASGPISRFRLICKTPRPVQLRLTYRTQTPDAPCITVRINGRDVDRTVGSNTWTTARFTLPAEWLSSGINAVEIHWPKPQWDRATRRDRLVRELEEGRGGEVCPVYGEIHTFLATLAADETAPILDNSRDRLQVESS